MNKEQTIKALMDCAAHISCESCPSKGVCPRQKQLLREAADMLVKQEEPIRVMLPRQKYTGMKITCTVEEFAKLVRACNETSRMMDCSRCPLHGICGENDGGIEQFVTAANIVEGWTGDE